MGKFMCKRFSLVKKEQFAFEQSNNLYLHKSEFILSSNKHNLVEDFSDGDYKANKSYGEMSINRMIKAYFSKSIAVPEFRKNPSESWYTLYHLQPLLLAHQVMHKYVPLI